MSQQTTLCLIHGHGVDASIWDGVYADLSVTTSVLRPDFSRFSHLQTIEAYAEELHAYLQNAQVDKVLLVGHSMGGYIALAFAEQYPGRVSGMCLFHSTVSADDEAKKEQRRQVIGKLKTEGSRDFLQTAITNMFAPDNRTKMADTIKALIDRYSDLPREALSAGVQAMLLRPDRTHVLQHATFPVMIVAGQHDQIIPIEKNRRLAEILSQAGLVVLNESGHVGMVEEQEATLQAIHSLVATV
ncbi:alpha/beta fold hydrolase [Spirosoma fluminis]